MNQLLPFIRPFLPLLAVLAAVAVVLAGVRYLLEKRYSQLPEARFRNQLILLALTLVGVLAVVVALPLSETLRGQLLSLIAILLSAAIALSSTTFLGNAMAGVLLRVVRSFRLGDFIQVGEHFGRVSERGLFHTEIQTEDRDLTTLPNLYLVTQPVKVVRASGTVVSAEVSLGYEVPRSTVNEALLVAAADAGLEEPFVQVLELGDFSVTYRVAGLLTEVKWIVSTKSNLRVAMLDRLHAAGIEIVSPSFMNTRAVTEGLRFIPPLEAIPEPTPAEIEKVVFDKAEEAESLANLEQQQELLEHKIKELEERLKSSDEDNRPQLERSLEASEAERDRLAAVVEQARAVQEEKDGS